MEEVKTVSTEELAVLKALRDDSDRIVINLGQVQFQKLLLESQEEQLKDVLIKHKLKEKEVTDSLVEKYGNVSVDIETGTIS
jgi:hypothetical protein